MSQKMNSIVAVLAIILLGIGGLFIAAGMFSFFSSITTTTTTTTDTSTTETTTTTTTNTTTTTTTTTIIEEPKILTILTRHDIAVQSVFTDAFLSLPYAIENNIIEIVWRAQSDEFWDDLILADEIDICWGGGVTLFDWLMQEGLLSPMNSTLMQEVESRVPDTIAGASMQGNNTLEQLVWIASKISSYGFMVNHAFLNDYSLPVPYYWENLSSPIYGQNLPTIPTIAMGNAPYTTSHAMIYHTTLQLMGWEAGWTHLTRMAGNAQICGGSVEAQTLVQNGDRGIVPCIDFYGFLSQFQNPDCEYIIPQDGTIIEGDPIAIAGSTVQKDLAEGFIDFVLSPYGQSLWLDEDLLRLPVLREAFDEPGASGKEYLYTIYNQTIESTSFVVNQTQFSSLSISVMNYFESVLTDSFTEQQDCWNTMVELYFDGNITLDELDLYAAEMAELMIIADPKTTLDEQFTLEYAIAINNDLMNDAVYANTVQTRWTTAAKIQYIQVRSDLLALYSMYDSQSVIGWAFIESFGGLVLGIIGTGGFVAIALIRPKHYQ